MLDDSELQDLQGHATELVRAAGKILLDYFDKPLTVDYKSANHRNPVTDADHAADDFIRLEIAKRFPEHAVVTEETETTSDEVRDVTWVVDPLDGTTNFLHGLPMFATMIAVLEKGRPMVGAIYTPRIGTTEGQVLHARQGGGAYEDKRLLHLHSEDPPRRMASVPGYFFRMFSERSHLRRRLGDVRTSGSAGYELAMTARGIFDYAVFNGPWVWDLAAGTLIIKEAGGAAKQRNSRDGTWEPFETFATTEERGPRPSELRSWRGTMVLGNPLVVEHITSGLVVRRYPLRDMRRRLSRLLSKG